MKSLEDALHDESADNSGEDVEPLDEGEHCHAVHMRPNVSRYPVAGRRSASRDRARLPKDARSGEARRKAESRVPSVERRAGRSDAGDPETPGKSEVSQSVHPVCPYCHAVHISVLPLGLPIGRRMAVRWDDYGPDALGVSKAERRRQFLEFMSTVATFADVSVEKKQESVRTRSVVLSSKNRDAQPDSLAFTTTPALFKMCKAWWSEFEERDGDAVSPQVKLRSLFRGSMSRNIARMYESPDNLLRLDAPSAPPAGYPWLPIPTTRVEIEERDVRFLESTARLALRASNFSEVLLQAWDASLEDVDLHLRMKKCLSSVVKTFMQTQVAITNGCLQLRRDHYLTSAKGLSADAVARLRHAPALKEKKLFPPELLKDVDELNQKQIQTKAFLRFATASTPRPRASRGRGKSDGDLRTGYHTTSTRHAQDPHQSSWYGRFYRASAIPVPVASCPPQKRGGGGTKFPINCSNRVATQVVSARESSVQPAVTASVTLSSSVTPSALTVTPSTGSTQAPRLASAVPSSFHEEAEALAVMQRIPVGGRLQFFWRRWRALGASKRVSRWLRRGYRLPFAPLGEASARALFRTSCPPALVVSYANPVKMRALLDLVETLLSKHVVEPVPADTPCLHNIVFLRPKPNSTWRLILDVSTLNKFLVVKTFSMDTVAVIRHAVTPSAFGTSVDWSDAYHHVPIHENFRDFLAFQVGSRRLRYVCCPFGLSPLPQVFTEVCLPLKAFARQTWGIPVFQYLDDWLFFANSQASVAAVTRDFVRWCIYLGLGVNLEKSSLVPPRQLVYLGVEWNFESASVRPPSAKSESVNLEALHLASVEAVTLPRLESFLGKLVALEKFVQYGRAHFRHLQLQLIRELRSGRSFR